MCWMAAVVAMQVAQTAMQAAQANAQAKAEAKSYRRAADLARSEADAQAGDDRDNAERLRAVLRTGYARHGVVSEGSPTDSLLSLAADQEDEIQRKLSRGYAQADTLDNQARQAKARGRYALLNGALSAGQSISGGIAKGFFDKAPAPTPTNGNDGRILMARGGELV